MLSLALAPVAQTTNHRYQWLTLIVRSAHERRKSLAPAAPLAHTGRSHCRYECRVGGFVGLLFRLEFELINSPPLPLPVLWAEASQFPAFRYKQPPEEILANANPSAGN